MTDSSTTNQPDPWGKSEFDLTSENPQEEQAAQPKPKRPGMIREVLETIFLAALIFVLVRAVVLNFRVDGHSMDPSLAHEEMLFVNRNAYAEWDLWATVDWLPFVDHEDEWNWTPFGDPERGDIIVFNPPEQFDNKPYIKRIIGLPGDTVEIHDNLVFVNGVQIDEPYIQGLTYCGTVPGSACETVVVPEGEVFVLGDNRERSQDSRRIGTIPISDIIGKAWFTYWPVDMFGPVPHEEYDELEP